MATRSFAALNPSALGPNLELEQSDLVLTHNTDADSTARHARGNLAVTDGYFEVIFYGADGSPANAFVGVASASASLSNYVGGDANGAGYRPSNGSIYRGNAEVVTGLATAALGDVIGIQLDSGTMTIYRNNIALGSYALPFGGPYYPAITVAGTIAYDLRAFANFGQRAFAQSFPGQFDGWYEDGESLPVVRAAARQPYMSHPIDTPANTPWPELVEERGASFERGVNFLPWGGSAIFRGSNGELSLRNDGRFDSYIAGDVRDEVVVFRAIEQDAPLEDSTIVATAIVDRIDVINPKLIRVALRDTLSLINEPLQRRLFPPSTPNEAVQNKPWPIALGAVRNIEPVLYDETNRLYALHDQSITQLATVRDKGDALDASTDYDLSGDLQTLILSDLPVGKLTADLSSSGEITIDPGSDDVLAGAGLFNATTWTENTLFGVNTDETPDRDIFVDVPAGWEIAPGADVPSGTDMLYVGDSTNWGWFPATGGSTWGGTGGASAKMTYGGQTVLRLSAIQELDSGVPWCLRTTSSVLVAGKQYRFNIVVPYVFGDDPGIGFGGLVIATDESMGDVVFGPINTAGTYSGTFTATSSTPLYLGVGRVSNFGKGKSAMVTTLTLEEIGEIEDAPTLEGITFTEFARQVLTVRGGQPETAWSEADTQAIDTAAPYPFGFFTADEITTLDAMSAPLHSFLASMYADRDGVIRFARMRKPELADDSEIVLELSPDNLLGDFEIVTDNAPGLTTRIGVRKNWTRLQESDFVDDYVEVPASLRKQFMQEAQIIRASAVNLAGPYRFAYGAAPLVSLLDDPAQGQAVIDELCGFYTDVRRFYRNLRVRMPANFAIDPASIIRLTFPRYGISNGVKLQVKTVRENWDDRELVLSAWGL